LSTPNLLTIDNEEAKIVVGQNVPFITGQFTNTGASSGNATVNPFQTIERKDVGITLRVKPQVSDGGTVKLQVFQEVSSVVDRSLSAGVITNKRSIESNVVVDDGQIIVLGGLIEDRSSNSQDKVPGLGDVPFFGNLFRYDSRKQNKTNLMVFLRPVVIRDANVSGSVVLDRYDYMRALSTESKPPANWALPDYAAPVPAPLNEKNTVPGNQPLIQQMRQAAPQPKP
jgi:general secretion pathway protein D